MRWNLHGVVVEGVATHDVLRRRWSAAFAACRRTVTPPEIRVRLDPTAFVPPPPALEPVLTQGDVLHYYADAPRVVAHFPRFGVLHLDPDHATTSGQLTPPSWEASGVLEDILAVALSPHLRRRGLFLLHAFAASHEGRAALLVGGIGAGKTTTGMALLEAGWQLLSNDSPIIARAGSVMSYPGQLTAFPQTLVRFARTSHLTDPRRQPDATTKIAVAAESIWDDVWADRAIAGAILFPRVEGVSTHVLDPIAPSETLRRLLPHAIERWDRAMIPDHLRVLRELAEVAPAFDLRLGPNTRTLPDLIARAVAAGNGPRSHR